MLYSIVINENLTINVFLMVLVNMSAVRQSPLSHSLIIGMTILEILLMFLLVFIYFILLIITLRSAQFQINLLRMIANVDFHLILLPFIRIQMLLYQFEFFQPYESQLADVILLISSHIKLYIVASSACFLGLVTVERCLATILVWSYEQNPRSYVSILLLLLASVGSHLVALFAAVGAAHNRNLLLMIGIPIYIFATTSMALIIYAIYQYNKRILNSFTHLDRIQRVNGKQYALSARFQVEENIRAIKLLKRFFIATTFGNCLGSLIGFTSFVILDPNSPLAQVSLAFYDLLNACYPLTLSYVMLLTVDEWRIQFLEFLSKLFHLKGFTRKPVLVAPEVFKETDFYFQYYRNSW